jgi:aryl-alcohol dehydrogenase-like predicted oxidoreductase
LAIELRRARVPHLVRDRFRLAQKPWIAPIPGTRNIDRLHENLGAVNVELMPADLREIEAAFSGITVHGARMNPIQMEFVDQTV